MVIDAFSLFYDCIAVVCSKKKKSLYMYQQFSKLLVHVYYEAVFKLIISDYQQATNSCDIYGNCCDGDVTLRTRSLHNLTWGNYR